MSCWTKKELEDMLEEVVTVLDLSDAMIEKHGQEGTTPAELVRLVLEQKDQEIIMLKRGFKSFKISQDKTCEHPYTFVTGKKVDMPKCQKCGEYL